MVVPNELVFVFMIVTEEIVLHRKYKEICEEQYTLLDILFCYSRALTLTEMGFYKSPTSANIYCSILNFLQTFTPLPQLSV